VAEVLAALLIGTLIGLFARPFLDAYVNWKTARLYAARSLEEERLFDESAFRKPLP
jgi:hypothetical protein